MAKVTDSETLQFEAEVGYDEGLVEGDFVTVRGPREDDPEYVAQITHTESAGEAVAATANVVGSFPDLPFREGAEIAKAGAEDVLAALDLHTDGVYLGDLRSFDARVHLDPEDVLTKQIGVYGRTEGGKSHSTKVLVEELLAEDVPVLVIDPHGEYGELAPEDPRTSILPGRGLRMGEQRFDVVEYADLDVTPDADRALEEGDDLDPEDLVDTRQATVLNLRGLRPDRLEERVADVLDDVFHARMRDEILPVKIVLEEAHEFAPSRKNETRPVVEAIAKQGRKFGCTFVVVTQRPSGIYSSIRSQMQSTIVHKLTDETDVDKVTDSVEGLDTSWGTQIQKLQTGEALVAGDLVESPAFVSVRPRAENVREGTIRSVLGR